jgi:methylmalonyl-CoA mutase
MNELKLGAEFPPASREDWLKLVELVLKGKPFDRLVARTYDGLPIEPLAPRAAQARPIAGRVPGEAWQILQRVDHPDPAAANVQALHDLENGATGLSLVFAGSPGDHGHGLSGDPQSLTRVLRGVHLGIPIELDLSRQHLEAATVLAELVRAAGIAPSEAHVRFGLDPFGAAALHGGAPVPGPRLSEALGRRVSNLAGLGFRGPFAAADGRIVHGAGGSEAQELGFVLSVGVAYLRALEKAGIALEAARSMIFFRLAADAEQFLAIAKFRALRKLWARVEESSGLEPEPIFVSAETAWRMMTRRDPHANMLRTTMAAFAAGLAGANAIVVLPFTTALGLPDGFARRIARNTQLILQEEANIARVVDPAAGSGGLERLTDELCAAAWRLFQGIEAAGGVWSALQQGLLQKAIAGVRVERERAIASGKEPLTGTTVFRNHDELEVVVLDAPRSAPALLPADAVRFEALAPVRLAEPFE